MTRLVCIDTETALIEPGLAAPPLVCLSAACEGRLGLFDHRDAITWVRSELECGSFLFGHNVAYDFAVLAAEAPDLLPLIFKAYEESRITDTMIRQKLIDIAKGEHRGVFNPLTEVFTTHEYSLAALTERHLGIELDKDTHRLQFGELRGVPIPQWPAGRADYAIEDADVTARVFAVQEQDASLLEDQFRQARAAWFMHLMSIWGIHTDPKAIDEFEIATLARFEKSKTLCIDRGLIRPKGTRDTKAARRYMIQMCESLGIKPKRTKGFFKLKRKQKNGETLTKRNLRDLEDPLHGISLDEEACLETGDELLQAYSEVSSLMTVVNDHIPWLRNGIQTPIQPSFDSLIATGRAACKGHSDKRPTNGFQMHNVRRLPGIRECFVPRPGCWFLSADYDGLELRTVAQVCNWVLGFSELGNRLNQGVDVHAQFATLILPGNLTWQEVKQEVEKGNKEFKGARQFSKVGNFGFWGGMMPPSFMLYARQPSNGGLKKSIEECRTLHKLWFQNTPEARPYFKWIKQLVGPSNSATIQHFKSHRYRGDLRFTVCANTFFQGLGADATKDAGFQISKECYVDHGTALYGCRMVNYVHDEFILEVRAHLPTARAAAKRLEEVMTTAAGRWLPDVPPTAPACLMERWSKNAKPTHDDNGELIPWKGE